MRILFTFLLFLFVGTIVQGQNNTLYTMFVFNKLQYNPAYAGSNDVLTVGAHYRHQWQGVLGAPRTVTAFAHMPIAENRNGIGLSLTSDEIGIFNTIYTNLSYAYRIGFNNDTKLSFGLNAQFDHTRFDWTKADLIDQVDASIPFGESASSAINFGLGLYYTGSNFYVGLSTPQLLRNAITSNDYNGLGDLNKLRTYYLMGGMVFPVGNTIHIKPALLISYVPNAPFEVDLNVSVLFLDSFWVGASYRLQESANVFVQVPVMENLKVAVGVDYALSALNQYSKGSFEVMLQYVFKQENGKVNNIRFF